MAARLFALLMGRPGGQRLFSFAPLLQQPCRRNMDNTPKTPKKVAFL